jgi:hypothetical protein
MADNKDGSIAARCISFARQGMVTFSYDMVGYNDTHFADSPASHLPLNLRLKTPIPQNAVITTRAPIGSRSADGFTPVLVWKDPRGERAGVRFLQNGISRIEPLNLSTPKGLQPPAQGCEERATLGTNAKKSFSLSSRGGRRGPGRGGFL